MNYNDPISLTITPDAGYALSSLTVRDSSGMLLIATADGFTMPSSNVTVRAAFAPTGTFTADDHTFVSVPAAAPTYDAASASAPSESADLTVNHSDSLSRLFIDKPEYCLYCGEIHTDNINGRFK